jgi:hypothetical protein
MESSSTPAQVSIGSGGGSLDGSLNSDFKVIKQLEAQSQSSIKNLSPNSNKVAEMGATYDMGSGVGMTKVNTGKAAQFDFSVLEIGKGGLVDEVF